MTRTRNEAASLALLAGRVFRGMRSQSGPRTSALVTVLMVLLVTLAGCGTDGPIPGTVGATSGTSTTGSTQAVIAASDAPPTTAGAVDVTASSNASGYKSAEAQATPVTLDFPVDAGAYKPGSYAGRTFYFDKVHLGEDIALAEGTAVRAIGTGRIVHYGPATGYGELVVVIEHDLKRPVSLVNGAGNVVTVSKVCSIYGHLRKSYKRGASPLFWQVNQIVGKGETIGFINDAANNGDGGVHLHIGLRLDAAPSAWGYFGYSNPAKNALSDVKYFAPASSVIQALSAAQSSPQLLGPTDKAVIPGTVTLQWKGAAGPTVTGRYSVRIWDPLGNKVYDLPQLQQNSLQWTPSIPGLYTWQVSTTLVSGGEAVSEKRTFMAEAFSKELPVRQPISSDNRRFQLVFQADGNLVLCDSYPSSRPIWEAKCQNRGGDLCLMQPDGNLVVYAAGIPIWSSKTNGNPGARLVVQGDGNTVIYRANNTVAWSTNTCQGFALTPGQQYRSPNGRYCLIFQTDGNLVHYDALPSWHYTWNARTQGKGADLCVMQPDGNLAVYSRGQCLWSSGTAGNPGSRLEIQNDGNLVIYRANGTAAWSIWTNR